MLFRSVVMDGKAVLRDKKEVKADSLQNPNDPDATYRAKNDQKVHVIRLFMQSIPDPQRHRQRDFILHRNY